VWFGKARWQEPATVPAGHGTPAAADDSGATTGDPSAAHGDEHGHGAKPHESPATMTIPLIILSVGAIFGGLINFPYFHWDFLEKFLAPVFPTAIDPAIHVGTTTKVVLSLVVLVGCLIGLVAGLRTWQTADHPALEPAVLQHGWYIDDALAATVSGPLTIGADGLAFGVDAQVIDGAVNGVAHLTTFSGRQLRKLQTGYVRTYAIGLAAGTAVVLCYVAARVGS
jgi:NADH-quinone oxidoreductase subunit L